MQVNFDSIKKRPLNELLRTICARLDEHSQAKKNIENSYRHGNMNDLYQHLKKCYESTKNQLSYETQQLIRKIIASDDTSDIPESKTGGHNMKLIVLMIALITAIGIVCLTVFKKKNSGISNHNVPNMSKVVYTQQDRDMLELIHLLATITNKTDAFLNN